MIEIESGLIVPVPSAEELVGPLRRRFDRDLGVPAHVTALAPFVDPASIDDDVIRDVRAFAALIEPFDFSLVRLDSWEASGRDDTNVLWLAPEPSEPFEQLIGAASDRFGLSPYGGIHDEVIPHLTVVHWTDPEVRAMAESTIAPTLPIQTRASELLLVARPAGEERWSTLAAARFGEA